jgi:hypothetical protein
MWSQILKSGLGQADVQPDAAAVRDSQPGSRPSAAFNDEVGRRLEGDRGRSGPAREAQGGAPDDASASAASSPSDAWAQMFQAGHEVQQQHLDNLQAIFDTVWGAGRRSP